MKGTLLVLLVSLASLADGALLKVLSAPNLLRVGTVENVFVECQDCSRGNIPVVITVKNHPTKTTTLTSTSVILSEAGSFQQLAQITIPAETFSKDPTRKQYVYLQAQFPGQELETVVLVSFQSGYIFIQTDKTIYTPNSKVHYRVFGLTPSMEPVERVPNTQTATSVAIDIVTPEDIVLPLEEVSLDSGIKSGSYQLPEIVSLGRWKVVVKFLNNPQQSYSAEFEVKEYVLPSFEVKLVPRSSFLYVDSTEFTIDIKAEYLFGEKVDGTAFAVFGVMQGGENSSLPGSLQRVQIEDGVGLVTLKKGHITQTYPNMNELVGGSLYVAVGVLTESGGELVEAELRNIQIVKSPYTISFKKTPRFFKPGMSFDVTVEVVNPDGSPAGGVRVVLEPGRKLGATATNGMAKLSVNSETSGGRLTITARTDAPFLSGDRQANASMVALPYFTPTNHYLHIGVDTAELKLGDNMKFSLVVSRTEKQAHDITYLILSRGQLVSHGRYKNTGQLLISLNLLITKDLLPSFRIVAYYHTQGNEVVSDSVWVDVKDSCMGTLRLEPATPAPSYRPRRSFELKVSGDPGAKVGLVAVDKGVFVLNNKHRLTQKKVWDIVEKHDTGCTPGGGKNNMGVFYDAGLLFESSTPSGTPYRQELKCPPPPTRRKRATTITEVSTSLVSRYVDAIQRECCVDGMRTTPLSYTCERRAEYIGDGDACVQAFLFCCREMETQWAERKEDELILARTDTLQYEESDDIVSRTNFPESWLWIDQTLPACPQDTPYCDTTSFTKKVPLQDSITTWQFLGISLSRTHGLCVAEPLEVIVRKDFFIDLRLPYSAVRGEQLEIKAILHNYTPDRIAVHVYLMEEEHVCSSASKRLRYHQEVHMGGQTTRSVPFIIIPMKEGTYNIEVKAAVRDVGGMGSGMSDGIAKKLLVVPEGVLVKSPQIITLDPVNEGVGGKQEVILNSQIPEHYMVQSAPKTTQISVTGREQVSALVNSITGASMAELIRLPSGCGEQNIAKMALPVIAVKYLDQTDQWEAAGLQRRKQALDYIKIGYQTELTYRKADGSFSLWDYSQSCSWLTAYVAKVFSMANEVVTVQQGHICEAVKFLILKAQQPDGLFREVGHVFRTQMWSTVTDSDASLTAYCLIAMQESRSRCAASVNSLPGSVGKAVSYLERRLPRLTNPYAVAITSYALANENRLNKYVLFKFASQDRSHWESGKGHGYTLEATAYALLTLVKAEAFEEARRVVRWFNTHQRVGGGFGSTQETVIVYQAIAAYWARAKEPQYDLSVDILLPGRAKPDSYGINKDNHYATRTSRMNKINQDVKVTAQGTGEATVKMVSLYYALPREQVSDCQRFNLSVQLLPEKMTGDKKTYKLKIEFFTKDKDNSATMSVLDIGLPTGFTVNTADLNLLSKGRARYIARYEMNTVLSERGSLIIYLDKVSNIRPEEISFRIHQELDVDFTQPAAVSLYEYYDQRPCVRFYHPERTEGKLLRVCGSDACRCAEESCSMQNKANITNEQRTAKVCESTRTSIIDFVYKVRLESFREDSSIDVYEGKVIEVIKEGSLDVGPLNQERTFVRYFYCRSALPLETGNSYLVMGTSKDVNRDDKGTFQYLLGERTWIEYWPTDMECQTEDHRKTCLGLEDMVSQYLIFGCRL